MVKYPNAVDRAEEAQVLLAAQALGKLAGLRFDKRLPVLPPGFSRCLIAPDAELLLMPSVITNGSDRLHVASGMRMARFNAVIVRISRPHVGEPKLWLDIGIDGAQPAWHAEYSLCFSAGTAYLAPPEGELGVTFRVDRKGLAPLVRARRLLQKVLVRGVADADDIMRRVWSVGSIEPVDLALGQCEPPWRTDPQDTTAEVRAFNNGW